MNCPLCGYFMSALDKECARCHGKGVPKTPKPTAPSQPAPVQPPQPLWPQQAATQAPPPQAPAPPAWGQPQPGFPPPPPTPNYPGEYDPVIPGALPMRSGLDPWLVVFVVSGLAYCLGFFAPWATFSILGFSININGGSGIEVLAVVAAIVAVCLAVWENFQPENPAISVLKCALSAGCLIFAISEAIYCGFLSQILQFGFGLALMVLAGAVATFAAFSRLRPALLPGLLLFTVFGLIGFGGAAGYKGKKAVDAMDPAKIFAGLGGSGSSSPVDNTPKVRSDVDVTINSTRETSTLETSTEGFNSPTASAGKTYLVCNLSVTFRGQTGHLDLSSSDIQLTGTDKQLYTGEVEMAPIRNITYLSGDLLPGGSATGDVIFEVNSGAKVDKIECLNSDF